MRVIVAANGDATSPKLPGRHFALIDGTPLLVRTVGQFAGHEVIVSGPDMRYHLPGAALYVPAPEPDNLDADILLSTRALWAGNDRTLLLLGDTYFTDDAVAAIVAAPRDWCYIGREGGGRYSGTDYGELFGLSFWPEHHEALLAAMYEVRRRQADEGLWRGGMWEHYRLLVGLDLLDHRLAGHFLTIDDETDDFDFAPQVAAWAAAANHEVVLT